MPFKSEILSRPNTPNGLATVLTKLIHDVECLTFEISKMNEQENEQEDQPLTLEQQPLSMEDLQPQDFVSLEIETAEMKLLESVEPRLENLFEELLHAHKHSPYFLSRAFKLMMECDTHWKREAVLFAIEDFLHELSNDVLSNLSSIQEAYSQDAQEICEIIHST
jgi:hypothetical protein